MKGKHTTVHPWHDLSPGEKLPEEVTAFIEVPKNSMLKYELDKESGFIKLDRVLYSAVHYPGDYGFIPQTLSEDGDPIDIIILSNFPVVPGVIVTARPIGVLEMIDDNERDEKIIAVHATDPRFERYHDIGDLSPHISLEIKNFFETYKTLQDKEVKILSIKDAAQARKDIQTAIQKYKETFTE
ncbi:MAG: inorganic diphosphatase [Nanoarchaeota archaeon]|nr:inorganic diphosphatase [Nanoarchaeota archaeon]